MKLRAAALATLLFLMTSSQNAYSQVYYTKTEVITYHDNLSKWVLGQVASSSTNGIESSRTEHDPATALPLKVYAFGKLQQALTYNNDGTVATTADGNGNVTKLSGWKRGIPQLIEYPATPDQPGGALKSSVVNDLGLVISVNDENDYQATYGYDPMGRLASISYPSDGGAGYNPVGMAFAPVNADQFGLPAGHWRSSRYEGNSHVNIYYDALWRPVVEERFDFGNISGTTSQVVKRYDSSGRLAFQSYPTRGVGNFNDPNLKGVRTEYDALDRVTAVRQDSELGVLNTVIEYLPGFLRRTTNPRNQVTTEYFQVFDVPSFDAPVRVDSPENVQTTIARDVFGKPLSIERASAN